MEKRFYSALLAAVLLLCSLPLPARAAASGTVLYGDYVAVVNTGTASQQTGSLVFDENAGGSAANETFALAEDVLLPVSDVLPPEESEDAAASSRRTQGFASYAPGDRKSFYQGTRFVCLSVGSRCFVWMEEKLYAQYSAENRELVGKEVAAMYDGRPSQVVDELSGNNPAVFADGTGKLSILIENISTSTGFYAGEDGITAIHIQSVPADTYRPGAYQKYDGLLVHEAQHAIFRHLACSGSKTLAYELSWINEGLSVAAMDYYWGGDDPTGWLSRISGNPDIRNGASLLYRDYRSDTALDYSMPYLFIRYLAAQKEKTYHPLEMIKAFYNNRMAAGQTVSYLNSVLSAAGLQDEGGGTLTLSSALANFYVAATAQENSGVYGFYGDAVVGKTVENYPIYAGKSGASVLLPGTAALILKTADGTFTVPDGAGPDIRFIAFDKGGSPYTPAQGSGTAKDPFLLETPEDFMALRANPSAYFRLGNDIDVSGVTTLPPDEFRGTLDGNGHTLSGMTKPLVYQNKGTLRNLKINGFSGEFSAWGGILSTFNSGTISDCAVTGTVTVRFTSARAFQTPCFGTMTAENEMSGIVKGCYSDADITLEMPANTCYAGMLVGMNRYELSNCYSRGSLTVRDSSDGRAALSIGGIAGEQYSTYRPYPSMENCYSVTAITVQNASAPAVGQVAGFVLVGSTLNACYGLQGSFPMVSNGVSGAVEKTETELKTQSTYQGWAFGSLWTMPAGNYPVFYVPSAGELTVSLPVTSYYVGEALNLYRAFLKTSGTDVGIALTADMLERFDSSTPGEKTVSGSYKGQPFTFQVTVKAPGSVSTLAVSNPPRRVYMEGEAFDPTGTRLLAALADSPFTYVSSGYSYDKTGPLTPSDTSVTFTYGNKSVSLPITVKARSASVSSIEVMNLPDNLTNYAEGDALDLTGLKVQLVYSDGQRSPVFGPEQLDANDIHLSLGGDKAYTVGQPLALSDNTALLCLYHGNQFPLGSGSTYVIVGQLQVKKTLWLEEQSFALTIGKEAYCYSDEVQGATALSTTLESGSLPKGIRLSLAPGESSYAFRFEGTPTELGETTAYYRITDTDTGHSILVKISFQVNQPSSACNLEQVLVKQKASDSTNYYGVLDHDNGTATVYVPASFNRSNVFCSFAVSVGAAPLGTFFGANFSSPVSYEVVAEDGIHKKTYTVSLVSIDLPTLAAPQELVWQDGVALWSPVENAAWYTVELYRVENISNSEYLTLLNSRALSASDETAVDFRSDLVKNWQYRFVVIARGDAVSYLDSSSASGNYSFSSPAATAVTLTPQEAQLSPGETLQFTATVEGVGSYSKSVVWSVSGNSSIGTAIADGLLTVSPEETSSALTVTAASEQTPDCHSIASVTVNTSLPALSAPQNLSWEGFTGKWDAVEKAESYRVVLLRNSAETGTAMLTNATSMDFTEKFSGPGSYTFRVQAFAKGFSLSELTESAALVPKILSVQLDPVSATLDAGTSKQFSASVSGEGVYDKSVLWSLEGNAVSGTTLSGGLLTLSPNQPAGTLTIKAVAAADSEKYASATITVEAAPAIQLGAPKNLRWSGSTAFWDAVPNAQKYAVFLERDGAPAASLTTSSTSLELSGSMTSYGSYRFRVQALGGTGYTASTVSDSPVLQAGISSVTVSPAAATVNSGGTQQFSVSVSGTGMYNPNVIWRISGQNLAAETKINASGLLTVAGNQAATSITVTATSLGDGSKAGSATVTVPAPPPIQLGAPKNLRWSGTTAQWDAVSNAQSYAVSVVRDDTVAASLTASSTSLELSGSMTSYGSYRFRVQALGGTGYTASTVSDSPVLQAGISSVTVSPAAATVSSGGTQQFSVSVSGTGMYNPNVIWRISGQNLAAETKINASGLLTVSEEQRGTALTVTAVAAGDSSKFGSATITVPDRVTKTAPIGGDIAISNSHPQTGEAVTLTVAVSSGAYLRGITVTDQSGTMLPLTRLGNGIYRFVYAGQPATVLPVFGFQDQFVSPAEAGIDRYLITERHDAYISGSSATLFSPGGYLTRAEAATIIYRLLRTKPEPSGTFSDVSDGDWFVREVRSLASAGILKGYSDGTFRPNNKITRAEFVTIIYRLTTSTSGIDLFQDVTAGSWFRDAVNCTASYGWVRGYSDGTFLPDKNIERCEAVTLINRVLGRAPDKAFIQNHPGSLRVFQDVPASTWFYFDVTEASTAHGFRADGGKESWS